MESAQAHLFPRPRATIVERIWAIVLAYYATGTLVPLTKRRISELLEADDPSLPCSLSTVERAFRDPENREWLHWPIFRGERPPWEASIVSIGERVEPLDEDLVVTVRWDNGEVLTANTAACNAVRRTHDEVIGGFYDEVLKEGMPSAVVTHPERVEALKRVADRKDTEIILGPFDDVWSRKALGDTPPEPVPVTITLRFTNYQFKNKLGWDSTVGAFVLHARRRDIQASAGLIVQSGKVVALPVLGSITRVLIAAASAFVLMDGMDGHIDAVIHWCRVLLPHIAKN